MIQKRKIKEQLKNIKKKLEARKSRQKITAKIYHNSN